MPQEKSMAPLELAREAVRILADKKAGDIKLLKIQELSTLGDYFVIASASNTTHVKALAEEVEFQLKEKHGVSPKRTEGYQSALWVLLDYHDVMIHVFYQETREFYSLERLWSDAPAVDISDLVGD